MPKQFTLPAYHCQACILPKMMKPTSLYLVVDARGLEVRLADADGFNKAVT
ncbi:hypothetical protein NC651_038436 [Populus alba x Populus x berolinensis]|nr:hypothetical protein NC651_038436 [Populus alba x Populus x berolinensis]